MKQTQEVMVDLKKRFYHASEIFIDSARREVEIARALNDPEAVVREQIKMEVMKHARSIFDDCYRQLLVAEEAYDGK